MEFLLSYFQFNFFADTATFHFPNIILKLKACDQLQNADKEGCLHSIFAMFCLGFSSKSKATVSQKHILKSEACDQSKQAKEEIILSHNKELFVCKVLCMFLIKVKSIWRRKIKEQTPTMTLVTLG